MKLSIRTKLIFLLFFLIFMAVALISGQAYRIAVKDMSNNAKANTRTYAKNISDVIQERMDAIKEKVLMAEMSENLNKGGSVPIFQRSPEIMAVTKFYFETQYSTPTQQRFLMNPMHEKDKGLTPENFDAMERSVDFKSLFKNNEFLSIGRIPNHKSDVMIFAFPIKATGEQGLYVFVAAITPDLVIKSIGSESAGSARGGGKYVNYLFDNKGRILVHPDAKQLSKNIYNLAIFKDFFSTDVVNERTREYRDENDQEVIGSIFKIRKSNIGVVSKILSRDAYAEAQKLKRVFLLTALFVFGMSLVIALYFAKTLSDPLLKLARVTGEIARGNFLVKVDVTSHDEIGDLASSFTKMGTELYNREQELNAAHNALVQSEKMSAFGQISAGIAHEVKNPLTGILGHAQLTKEKITRICTDGVPADVDNSLSIIERETKRCKTIIENLMKFSRQEKTQFVEEDISAVARGAIALVDHQITLAGVKIFREIPDGFPKVMCSANQIEQVMMNIMLNAQHAMDGRPEKKLTVRVKQGRTGFARIEIQDTGSGMPEEVKKKIFEPFFTTKPPGKGTGLGLSVSYGIIKDHKGLLDVESKQEVGTTFIIELPYKNPNEVADFSKLTMPKEEVPTARPAQAQAAPAAQTVTAPTGVTPVTPPRAQPAAPTQTKTATQPSGAAMPPPPRPTTAPKDTDKAEEKPGMPGSIPRPQRRG